MKSAGGHSPIEVYNSVGGGAFFRRLLTEWREAGEEIISVEAISESDYRIRRSAPSRLALRWRMYPGYAWACWSGARKRRSHAAVRVVTTNPFFAPAIVAQATRGHGITINLVYDLFPEALLQTGRIARGSWMERRCAALTRYAMRECAATVFLGERLKAQAETAYGPARRAAVIPVGADGLPFRQHPPQRLVAGTRPHILYSGQMGRMHDTDTLEKAWATAPSKEVTWAFHASGAGYRRLRETRHPPANVTWGDALPEAAWQQTMKQAQIALITIAPGAERVVMPSKTYSAMVAGQAIVGICRRASDLADLIAEHDCGWIVEPGDSVALNHVLERIIKEPDELWTKRRNAFDAGHRYFDMAPLAQSWLKLFQTLREEGRGAETDAGKRLAL